MDLNTLEIVISEHEATNYTKLSFWCIWKVFWRQDLGEQALHSAHNTNTLCVRCFFMYEPFEIVHRLICM